MTVFKNCLSPLNCSYVLHNLLEETHCESYLSRLLASLSGPLINTVVPSFSLNNTVLETLHNLKLVLEEKADSGFRCFPFVPAYFVFFVFGFLH